MVNNTKGAHMRHRDAIEVTQRGELFTVFVCGEVVAHMAERDVLIHPEGDLKGMEVPTFIRNRWPDNNSKGA